MREKERRGRKRVREKERREKERRGRKREEGEMRQIE